MSASTTAAPNPLLALMSDTRLIFQKNRPELLSSLAARAVTILLLNPIDAAKSRLQATKATSKLALRAVYKSGPPLAGAIPGALAHAPGGVLAFVLYVHFCSKLQRRKGAPIAAACLADAVAALWTAPLEAAKQRIQTGVTASSGSALRLAAPWYGLGAQIMRDVPFRALHLVFYEQASRVMKEKLGRDLTVRDGALVGMVVGGGVGAVTTPLDVIKTRVMAQRPGHGKSYAGWIACARRTVSTEGVGGMFRGMGMRTVYMAASVAVFAAAYEGIRKSWREKEAKPE